MMDQTLKDLEKWSCDRLQKWFDDSIMRYEVAGGDTREITSLLLFTLMRVMSAVLARGTSMSPEMAASALAETVRHIRERDAAKHKEQEQ